MQVATTETYPLIVYIYSGFVNIFVPSGGSKWLIEAPYLLPAATELAVSPTTTLLAYCYGDSTSNLIQPFWAIPILTVTRMKFGDILGYSGTGSGVLGSTASAPHLGAVGLALGSAVAAWLELLLLGRLAGRSVAGLPRPAGVLVPLVPAAGAAFAVGALLRLATAGIAPQLAAPLALLVAGGVYTVVARLTGVAEAGLVLDPILRRLRR